MSIPYNYPSWYKGIFIILVPAGIENKLGISLIGYNSFDMFSFKYSKDYSKSGFIRIYLKFGSQLKTSSSIPSFFKNSLNFADN